MWVYENSHRCPSRKERKRNFRRPIRRRIKKKILWHQSLCRVFVPGMSLDMFYDSFFRMYRFSFGGLLVICAHLVVLSNREIWFPPAPNGYLLLLLIDKTFFFAFSFWMPCCCCCWLMLALSFSYYTLRSGTLPSDNSGRFPLAVRVV